PVIARKSRPAITSTTNRARCRSGSHSSTDGGIRKPVSRSIGRKLLMRGMSGVGEGESVSPSYRTPPRRVKSDRLLDNPRPDPASRPNRRFFSKKLRIQVGIDISDPQLAQPQPHRSLCHAARIARDCAPYLPTSTESDPEPSKRQYGTGYATSSRARDRRPRGSASGTCERDKDVFALQPTPRPV